ncbi:MAG: site-specific integrase [Pseudomonadota bacterium]
MNANPLPLAVHRALRPEERDRLRAHLAGQLALAVAKGRWRARRDAVFGLVLLEVGLRVSEACALHRADFRVEGGERRLVVRKGKGGKRREVRLPESLRVVLRAYLDATPGEPEAPAFPGTMQGEAMCRVTAWRRWKKTLAALGLDAHGRGCHAARHGLGLALYKNTSDLRLVAAQLGHTDLRSTLVYTAPLPEDIDAALDAVNQPLAAAGGRR